MATLTTRQSRFVAAYSGNATQAAIEAGYSPRSARQHAARMMTNAAIQAEIQARQAQDSQRLQLERQDVIAGLLEAVEIARAQGNAGGLISAWSAISRLLGLAAPERHHVEITSTAALAERGRFEAMSDEQLMAVVAAGS